MIARTRRPTPSRIDGRVARHDLPRVPSRAPVAASILALLALTGCGGGDGDASSPEGRSHRAIDGYLVGASVTCDAEPSGGTGAGGLFDCPAGTDEVRVRGGRDVGFDPDAIEGGVAFVGELAAPGHLDQVTPLSTLALAMATEADGFDRAAFDAAVGSLGRVLGADALDLAADAASEMTLVRLNAQVQQVLAAFGPNVDAHRAVTRALAGLVVELDASGRALDPVDDAGSLLEMLNARLALAASDLVMAPELLDAAAARLQRVNAEIAFADDPAPVADAVAAAIGDDALTLVREATALRTFSGNDRYDDVSLASFADDALVDGRYATVIDRDLAGLGFGADAFRVGEDLDGVRVALGFELVATSPGDARRMSFATQDARLSGIAGEATSLRVSLPRGSVLAARGVEADGTETAVRVRTGAARDFSAADGGTRIDFETIEEELAERGFRSLTSRPGNYRLTLVIGGLRVGEIDRGEPVRPALHFVDSGEAVVTGAGFRGYVTIDAGGRGTDPS